MRHRGVVNGTTRPQTQRQSWATRVALRRSTSNPSWCLICRMQATHY